MKFAAYNTTTVEFLLGVAGKDLEFWRPWPWNGIPLESVSSESFDGIFFFFLRILPNHRGSVKLLMTKFNRFFFPHKSQCSNINFFLNFLIWNLTSDNFPLAARTFKNLTGDFVKLFTFDIFNSQIGWINTQICCSFLSINLVAFSFCLLKIDCQQGQMALNFVSVASNILWNYPPSVSESGCKLVALSTLNTQLKPVHRRAVDNYWNKKSKRISSNWMRNWGHWNLLSGT